MQSTSEKVAAPEAFAESETTELQISPEGIKLSVDDPTPLEIAALALVVFLGLTIVWGRNLRSKWRDRDPRG